MNGISLTFAGLDKVGAEMLIEMYSDIMSGAVGEITTRGAVASNPVMTARGDHAALAADIQAEIHSGAVLPAAAPAVAADGVRTHDGRGVPFNPAYHSDSRQLKEDGAWRRRRGTGPKGAEIDAWEATQITGGSVGASVSASAGAAHPNGASNAASNAPTHAASNGASAVTAAGVSPAPVGANGPAVLQAPSPMPAYATAAPTPTLAPSPEAYAALWGKLCAERKVDLRHQDSIVTRFGAHPANVVDAGDRAQVFAMMQRWDAGDTTI